MKKLHIEIDIVREGNQDFWERFKEEIQEFYKNSVTVVPTEEAVIRIVDRKIKV